MKVNMVSRYVVVFTAEWHIPRLHRLEYLDGNKSVPLSSDRLKSLLRYSKLYRQKNSAYCTKTGREIATILKVDIPKREDRFVNKDRNFNINANLIMSLKEVEKKMILLVLKYTKGNILDTSRILGITAPTLRVKLKSHELTQRIIYNLINGVTDAISN